jgi:hypothetical protein
VSTDLLTGSEVSDRRSLFSGVLTVSTLGDLLLKQYGRALADEIRKLMKPTLHMLSREWGVMQVPQMGGIQRRFLHYCPTGDIRAAKGKICELCRSEVPEAVQFMAQALFPSKT